MTGSQALVRSSADGPSGISGWLVLPITGLVVTNALPELIRCIPSMRVSRRVANTFVN